MVTTCWRVSGEIWELWERGTRDGAEAEEAWTNGVLEAETGEELVVVHGKRVGVVGIRGWPMGCCS